MRSKGLFFFLIALSVSCSSDYSPKPKGYFYIDLPQPVYRDWVNFPSFECTISNQVIVKEEKKEPDETKEKKGIGFNLIYPRFHAQIYCTYFQIVPSDFSVLSEECHRMATLQEKKAKGVTEVAYNNPEQKVYGLIYEIEGDAASPIQFVISDSVHSFLRGALYFDTAFNRDSVAPVLAYINKDIHVIFESFRWKQ